MFNPDEAKYANGVVVDLPYPTDEVRLLTKAAVDVVDHIYRPGSKYSKAEVMLLNLCQSGEYTDDLFAVSQPAEATRVMAVLDRINERWGRGTLRSASVLTDVSGNDESELYDEAGSDLVGCLQVGGSGRTPGRGKSVPKLKLHSS